MKNTNVETTGSLSLAVSKSRDSGIAAAVVAAMTVLMTVLMSTVAIASDVDYRATCRIDDGVAIASLETESASVSLHGKVKMKTFDRWGNSVGEISTYKDREIGTYQTKSVMIEPVEWFVKSCSLDLKRANVDVVIHHRSHHTSHRSVVVHTSPVPSVVIGFPFPLPISLSSTSRTVIHTHNHDRWCGHRSSHVTIRTGSRSHHRPHQSRVIINTNKHKRHDRNHSRSRTVIKTSRADKKRNHGRSGTTVIKVNHRS